MIIPVLPGCLQLQTNHADLFTLLHTDIQPKFEHHMSDGLILKHSETGQFWFHKMPLGSHATRYRNLLAYGLPIYDIYGIYNRTWYFSWLHGGQGRGILTLQELKKTITRLHAHNQPNNALNSLSNNDQFCFKEI